MSDFVEGQRDETLEIAEAGLVWNNYPFLQTKKDVGVPTIQLGQV